MDERKTSCKTTLRDICKLIQKQIPSDKDNQKTYYFLQAISKVPDTSVQHYVSRYEEGEYVSEDHQYITQSTCYAGNGYGDGDDWKLADWNGDLNGGHFNIVYVEMAASW